jgi:hypothetical protein
MQKSLLAGVVLASFVGAAHAQHVKLQDIPNYSLACESQTVHQNGVVHTRITVDVNPGEKTVVVHHKIGEDSTFQIGKKSFVSIQTDLDDFGHTVFVPYIPIVYFGDSGFGWMIVPNSSGINYSGPEGMFDCI